jgi:acid phosphatase (class A)
MRTSLIIATAIAALAGGLAVAQQPAAPPIVGYVPTAMIPQGLAILPPAPQPGTDRYAMDRKVFTASRSLEGSPRWALAQNDNNTSVPNLLADFSCALGVKLTPDNAPKLTHLLARAARDASAVTNAAKDALKRERPFHIDPGNICIPHDNGLDNSFDYPSGHTTMGWTFGLILADLEPDKATEVLVRARSYGESRVVCGVHNSSAIEAGRTSGAMTFAAQQGYPEFRADLEAARVELAGLRANAANATDAGLCKAEADLIAKTPYPY